MTKENVYNVVMPKLGMIMTEAVLVTWHTQEGNWIEKGAPLFDFESDKSTITIEAPISGYVHLLASEGENIPVKTPVAAISPSKDAADKETVPVKAEEQAATSETAAAVATVSSTPAAGKGVRATPKARTIARLKGLSLEGITGTGPRGMIVAADLEKASAAKKTIKASPLARKIAGSNQIDLSTVTGSGIRGQITRADVEQAIEAQKAVPAVQEFVQVQPSLPLTGLRAIIAERLSTGWRERPQVTLTTEVDASNLVNARKQIIAETGTKVSYNTFIVMAAAQALKQMPFANVQLTDEGIVTMPEINIGVAVDSDRGLLVPVVHNADQKELFELDAAFRDAAERALEGKSLPDELTGGTLTVTNLGGFGIDAFTPIINPPEATILGVGRIAKRPVVVDDQIVARETVVLSLSFDHRILDGAPAARFLQRIAQLIERPIALFSDKFGS